jgi:hypothetical protein
MPVLNVEHLNRNICGRLQLHLDIHTYNSARVVLGTNLEALQCRIPKKQKKLKINSMRYKIN